MSKSKATPAVSIYLPTSGRGRSEPADALRLKNGLSEARERLLEQHDGALAEELLSSGRRLLDDRRFWRASDQGLALFVAPGLFEPLWLSEPPERLVVVGGRFELRPLIQLATNEKRFATLALSRRQVRLLRCTPHRQRRVELDEEGLLGLAAARGELERPQLRSHTRGSGRERSEPQKAFHGVGVADEQLEQGRFLRAVDQAVCEALAPGTEPLVVIAAERTLAAFHEVSEQSALVRPGLPVNPEPLDDVELRERAWPLAQQRLDERRAQALSRYRQLASRGDLASDDVRRLLPASCAGEVDTLFVTEAPPRWGRYDPAAETLELHDQDQRLGDEDLLDRIVVESFLRGATIYVVDPSSLEVGAVAAILRYPSPL